jgi:UrcA family protein
MNKHQTVAALGIALISGATLARAEPSQFPVSRVSHADLDLSRERDRVKLNHRLHTAVDKVCGFALTGDLRGQNDVFRCLKETSRNASLQSKTVISETLRTQQVTAIGSK